MLRLATKMVTSAALGIPTHNASITRLRAFQFAAWPWQYSMQFSEARVDRSILDRAVRARQVKVVCTLLVLAALQRSMSVLQCRMTPDFR